METHGLKYGVANIFDTFLQFIFGCTEMNRYFFRDLLIREISTHGDTCQEETSLYTLGINV